MYRKIISCLIASIVLIPSLCYAELSAKPNTKASKVKTVITNFNNHLSSADTDVQKALETLDDVAESDPIVRGIVGIVKSNGTTISTASSGSDYLAPFTAQTSKYFYAAPNASDGTPSFRAIEASDIPILNQNTSGSSGSCSGNSATVTGFSSATGKTLSVLKTMSFTAADDTGVYTLPTGTKTLLDTTGTAAKATILATTRAINGTNFNGSAAITVPVNNTDDSSTNGNMFPLWTASQGGNYAAKTSSGLNYNPSTKVFSAAHFKLSNTSYLVDQLSGSQDIGLAALGKVDDMLRGRTIVATEYWNGSAWVAWYDSNSNYLSDGDYSTLMYVNNSHAKWRVTWSGMAWKRTFAIGINKGYGDDGEYEKPYSLLLETSPDNVTYTTRLNPGFNYVVGYQDLYFGITEYGDQYWRITVDYNSALGANVATWYEIAIYGYDPSVNSNPYQLNGQSGASIRGTVTTYLNDATTNSVSEVMRLTHLGGAIANGFGSGLDFYLEDATAATAQQASRIGTLWIDATDATRTSAITFSTVVSGASLSEAARFDSSTTAGDTRFMLYDVDNGTIERVTVGIADSGGVGYKVLRIPN